MASKTEDQEVKLLRIIATISGPPDKLLEDFRAGFADDPKALKAIDETLDEDRIRDAMIEAGLDAYTDVDIDFLDEFYQSDTGRRFAEIIRRTSAAFYEAMEQRQRQLLVELITRSLAD